MNIKDFIEKIIKEEVKTLKESDYEEISRIRDSGDHSQQDMEYEVVNLIQSMQTISAEDVIQIMYDALDAEDRHDESFWHSMLSPGGNLMDALTGLEQTADDEYMPDTVAENQDPHVPEDDEEDVDATADMSDEEVARLAAQYASEAEFDEIYQESKGLATGRIAQHGLDTAPSGMDDAHRAVVDAGGYNSPGMMRLMRTIAQAARGMNLSPQETLQLAQSMLDADMLRTAETDPTGSLEENAPSGQPLQGQELRDALHSDISDMFKDMNGIRPRWINFQAMSQQELENLHDQTSRQHSDWHNQERVEDDLDDLGYERELRNAAQHNAATEQDRIDAIEAETERMKKPEEGEEFAKHGGMGRGPRESWSSFGGAKTLFEGWRKFTEE
jgi:hypothetical protein